MAKKSAKEMSEALDRQRRQLHGNASKDNPISQPKIKVDMHELKKLWIKERNRIEHEAAQLQLVMLRAAIHAYNSERKKMEDAAQAQFIGDAVAAFGKENLDEILEIRQEILGKFASVLVDYEICVNEASQYALKTLADRYNKKFFERDRDWNSL
jgi:hypothetical protein